jgi:hypothetical protein
MMMKGRDAIASVVITGLLVVGVVLALTLPFLRTIYATEIDAWWRGVLNAIGISVPMYYAMAVPLSVVLIWWRFKR